MKSCSVRKQDQTIHDFFQVHYPSQRIEISSLGRTAGTKIWQYSLHTARTVLAHSLLLPLDYQLTNDSL